MKYCFRLLEKNSWAWGDSSFNQLLTGTRKKIVQQLDEQFRGVIERNCNKQHVGWQEHSKHTRFSFTNTLTISDPAFSWGIKNEGDRSFGFWTAQCTSRVHNSTDGRAVCVRDELEWVVLPIWESHLQVLSSVSVVGIKFPLWEEHLFPSVCWKGVPDLLREKECTCTFQLTFILHSRWGENN